MLIRNIDIQATNWLMALNMKSALHGPKYDIY